jgi:hypothetical protein
MAWVSSTVVASLVSVTGPLADVTVLMPEVRQGVHETVDIVLLFSDQQ